jgi:alkanesulfonate monooxygenase SsuD/methylene tetrahydromethanopterin reductase-like flavin-dependent oxidoreductase (luciferase family)
MAAGSVSFRLYPHRLEATATVDTLLEEGCLATGVGLDGIMTAEHHGGFGGYLPNPMQVAGWLLDAMPAGWAGACPLLLPLRPSALVVEETAWLAARFPGRVGLGVAAGSLADDFEIMGTDKTDLARRFADGLAAVTGMLSGRAPGRLAGDPAVARCVDHPVPVLSGAMSPRAVRRAAACGAGLIFDSMSSLSRIGELMAAYRSAGGTGPTVMTRRVWVGPPPLRQIDRQRDLYHSYSDPAATAHFDGNETVVAPDPAALAERLRAILAATGVGGLNLRLHAPGIPHEAIVEQLPELGEAASLMRGAATGSGAAGGIDPAGTRGEGSASSPEVLPPPTP